MKKLLAVLICLGSTGINAQPVWNKEIAPLVFKYCTPCHHRGGSAPFALETYREVSKRAEFVAYVTDLGYMPPWKANPAYRHFANERILSAEEKLLLADWAAAGAPLGEGSSPDPPVFPEGAQLKNPPDLVLRMEKPFPVPGGNQQTYICTAIPYSLPADTFVSALEYLPGNRRLTHHVSFQFLEVHPEVDLEKVGGWFVYGEEDFINDRHDYGFFGLIGPDGEMPREVFHGGWLPGTSPQEFAPGSGFRLPRRGVLLIRNLHYAPTPVPAEDQATVNLFFARQPVTRPVMFAAFKPRLRGPEQAVIPADSVVKYEIKVKVHDSLWLTHVNPHMHLLGRSFRVWALPPEGDTIRLVDVPEWDFNWQEFYRFEEEVLLPAGSYLHAEAWFDNTSSNYSNPNNPPRDVHFERGMDDEDEMMRLVFLFVPVSAEGANKF